MKILPICVLLAVTALPAAATEYRGKIELQLPVGQPDRPADQTPTVVASLELPRVLGSLTLGLDVQHNTREGQPWERENKLRATLSAPLGQSVLFVYGERRYSTGDERVMAGVRVPFHGRF